MENKTTAQGNIIHGNKKGWESPALVVINTNSITGGAVAGSVEGGATLIPGSAGKTYHS